MRVKYILDEDVVNYKKTSMFIATTICNGKCYRELGLFGDVCQNHELMQMPIIDISDDSICTRYLNNPLTNAIVFGGLEPFDQFDELNNFIDIFRNQYKCNDDIVIYTGYNLGEITDKVARLAKKYTNIIIKFGRYIPNSKPIFNNLLGVTLASNNQWAARFHVFNG